MRSLSWVQGLGVAALVSSAGGADGSQAEASQTKVFHARKVWTGQGTVIEPAVVVVIGEGDIIEPRMVTIGMTDWDFTEVVSGLEEGDRVALIGLAQLQAQREEFMERMRSMGRGNPFGGGRMGGFRGGMPH